MKRLLLTSLFFTIYAYCSVDLEERMQDFVLSTKRIEVPGYPFALNPSIIQLKEGLLMSFRIFPDPNQKYLSQIGVVWLDEEFNTISKPQILDLCPEGIPKENPSRAEDGRLIAVGDSLYLVYDDNRDIKISKGGFRIYTAQLEITEKKIVPKQIEAIKYFDGENPNRREKSWTPFSFQGELFLAYSLSPHIIFRHLPGLGAAETVAISHPDIKWDFGELRGGTPALNMDNRFYLAFFHSSIPMKTVHSDNKESLHYFMGAYTFSLAPPFEITHTSQEPIIAKNFYSGEIYKPYWHPIQAIFPAGYLCRKDKIFVFYGRQDHELWVVTLDKKGLLDSLKPIKSVL